MTDGVIFQPDKAYTMGTDFDLLKWKWLDTVTVDMAVQMADGEPIFSCSNNQGVDVEFKSEQITLSPHDRRRLVIGPNYHYIRPKIGPSPHDRRSLVS